MVWKPENGPHIAPYGLVACTVADAEEGVREGKVMHNRDSREQDGRSFRLAKSRVRFWESGVLALALLFSGVISLPSAGCSELAPGEGLLSLGLITMGVVILVVRWVHRRRLL